ncbi:hypothetical protein Z949_1574 [Sulfitobacter guttiformis KCTC 32187]|nr:hypothetical protein Z949_1574 [Sulfitobacter guttiformis KCTC 32187]
MLRTVLGIPYKLELLAAYPASKYAKIKAAGASTQMSGFNREPF